MLSTMKNNSRRNIFLLALMFFLSCGKQDLLSPIPVEEIKISFISFKQDTVPVTLTVTSARKENVGSLFATSIDGKFPDSILQMNNLIIRVTGDSARLYNHTEIFASYTDSSGNTFANDVADTINTVRITKMEKRQNGNVEGNFTIRVSNFTKTKTLLLNNGKFSTAFSE
jgi:hypothetical protein